MKEWGSKYDTETKAWEILKGICASSDIQLQDILAETENEVIPESATKIEVEEEPNKQAHVTEGEIMDVTHSENTPLMAMKTLGTKTHQEKHEQYKPLK